MTIRVPDDFRQFIERLSIKTGVPIDVDEAWAESQNRIAPPQPANLASCQHHRINNETGCCTVCGEQMVAWTVEAKTVLSAPNVNPCTDPECYAAIERGEDPHCTTGYVPGPARTVVVGYEIEYQCERCTHSFDLIEGTVFVPDCGHSHRGDLLRQGFNNVLAIGDGQ